MRLTINLDEQLIEEARRMTGTQDTTALIHEGLRALIAREGAGVLPASAEATHARKHPEGAAFRNHRRHSFWSGHPRKTVRSSAVG
jgi:Arc/MetJ family transcription regulator